MLRAKLMEFLSKRKKYGRLRTYVGLTLIIFLSVALIASRRNSYFYYSDYLLRSLDGPIRYDDPELIKYLINEVLDPPSTLPYNMTTHISEDHKQLGSVRFYDSYVKKIFNSTRGGFFVEAGALDGQTMSNTLWLEKHREWTGLLVEPDPANYYALQCKHRKAWSAKACLSMEKYPKNEKLTSYNMRGSSGYHDMKYRAMGTIFRPERLKIVTQDILSNSYYNRNCFPLESLLLALNVTRVDFLSLDVEFIEEYVINNFDFERFDIQVLFIEWWKTEKQMWLHEHLSSKGYIFIDNVLGDVIYIKQGTKYLGIMDEIKPNRTLQVWFEQE